MKICRYCKHSIVTSMPDTPCCDVKCKKHFIIGPVTGFKRYINCDTINTDGNCQDYEESWFRKLINKIFKYL